MTSAILRKLGIDPINSGVFSGNWIRRPKGPEILSVNPSTGKPIARVLSASREDYEIVVEGAQKAFQKWRCVPPPQRGEIVRKIGEELRRYKRELGGLVTLETGKILAEGEGEVQEMIDIADFSVGLSRQLYGLTIASERPHHRMFEQWHPLGPIGVLTAFNFPVAVWSWNALIAAVCGDTMVWKPSSHTPLTAIAVQNIIRKVLAREELEGVFNLCIGGGSEIGEWMAQDKRLPLISATGSCAMGKRLAQRMAQRLGRTILELGGNNAVIVAPSANLNLALRSILFAAVGTSGQRCTTLRRLILHRSIAKKFIRRLIQAYQQIPIGEPWKKGVLMGPLITESAVQRMMEALEEIQKQGGKILCGGKRLKRSGYFVQPTLVQADPKMPIVQEETFAPILYVMTYDRLEEAIRIHNAVPQGLSSGIFTNDLRETEVFLSAMGSDCGIANVNIATSGAEIGGAFGGEKETGGGREAGSDAWKAYMRRQTCTIHFGKNLPLAQGIEFRAPLKTPRSW